MTIRHFCLLALAWFGLAPWALSEPAAKDALASFQKALKQDGFDVNAGGATVLNLVAAWCANTPGLDNALYANNQPYLQLLVPESAKNPKNLIAAFKLDPQEAIVLIGRTPPAEKYFGFYAFLRSRVGANGRQSLWVSMGDPVNNASVKTTGTSPFNSPVAVVFTPDQGTDARVRAALAAAGYPSAIVNTVVFPVSMLRLGHSADADELFVAVRNALWEVPADGDAYIQNPPLSLFRVTPRNASTPDPFPAPMLRVRGTGQTEMDLMPRMAQLRDAIVKSNAGLYWKEFTMQTAAYEGFDYLQRGIDPWGDTRDSLFLTGGYTPDFGSNEKVKLGDGEFLMVYGVNHVATGKASYTSANVYSDEGAVPIGGVDYRDYKDTAKLYLGNDPDADLMYAYKIARDCQGQSNCQPLKIDNCSRLVIGPDTLLSFWFRAYLEPATKSGPAMPEILYDRVIKFSPRPIQ